MLSSKKEIKELLQQNKGSGVVSVLVAMMFLTILGIIVMYLSYTGFLMKMTEREGTDNFYQAEAAMNVVRAQVQTTVSDSISIAYNDVLSQYSSESENQFQEFFKTAFYEYEYEYTEATGAASSYKNLFPQYGTSALLTTTPTLAEYYDVSVFEQLFEDMGILNVTVSVAETSRYTASGSSNTSYGIVEVGTDAISLKGICVTYTNPETGYATTIQSDIACIIPEFYASSLGYSITTVPNFALIAQDAITKDAGNSELTIDGNAYAGSLSIGGLATSADCSFSVTGGSLIVGGDTKIYNRATFMIDESADVWTENILLEGGVSSADTENSSSVTLEGTLYVADDLELNGDDTKVATTGTSASYYGFGDGTSSIVINGRSTEIDLDGISELMLAGYSFINTSTTSGVMMGESVSVKSNQLLYLAPVDILGGTVSSNPVVYADTDIVPDDITAPSAFLVNGIEISTDTKIQTFTYVLTNGYKAKYYYLDFNTIEDANAYFTAYFTTYPESIEDYISLYTDGIQLPDDITMSGNALEVTENEEEVITGLIAAASDTARDQMERDAEMMQYTYAQLCKTLSTTVTSTTVNNPYEYIVDVDALGTFIMSHSGSNQFAFIDTNGAVVAMLIDNDSSTAEDYIVEDSAPAIILATGNVTINARDYTGMIIAGGTIKLNTTAKTITADENAVNEAFQGKYDGDTAFYTLLNSDVVGSTESSATAQEYTWDLDELVIYENWKRS
ncbi:MAG: hypothetical protein R3Y47_07950 [Lachnospiraceae bacterium]